MDEQYRYTLTPEERAARRADRARQRQQQKQQRLRALLRRLIPTGIAGIAVIAFLAFNDSSPKAQPADEIPSAPQVEVSLPEPIPEPVPEPEPPAPNEFLYTDSTVQITDLIDSSYAIVVDLENNTVLADKNSETVISPASMTKILTLLVAAEHLTPEDLDKTFTMTIDITDYCYVNGLSVVGLMVGETVPVRELLYGTILPSGADASLGLAVYTAGSHEAFVEWMNEKLEELGISSTAHFTNCVGAYDEAHHCTAKDMAVILKAAMENELCREVLRARIFETQSTTDHPDGQVLSNWFLRRIEDKDTGDITVVGAKTGYVSQSGSCAASCGQRSDGSLYICITGDAHSSWRAIYDHVALYSEYCN